MILPIETHDGASASLPDTHLTVESILTNGKVAGLPIPVSQWCQWRAASDGRTLLHLAVQKASCVDTLLGLLRAYPPIPINAQDKYGRTVLHWAVHLDKRNFVDALLEASKNDPSFINLRDLNGKKAADLAMSQEVRELFSSEQQYQCHISAEWNA